MDIITREFLTLLSVIDIEKASTRSLLRSYYICLWLTIEQDCGCYRRFYLTDWQSYTERISAELQKRNFVIPPPKSTEEAKLLKELLDIDTA